jgi:methylenetetrahydrofolate dehydrogenase (NADP+) / methenyltetrahydrofolate cyclohydrolase
MANMIDGKAIAQKLKASLKLEVEKSKAILGVPGLAVVIVGNNSASRVYVNAKKKACEEIGIQSFEFALDEKTTQQELVGLVHRLNQDPKVNGILVQLPLPDGLDSDEVIKAIDPQKDVDCFHPQNVGNLMMGKPIFEPCTPGGIMELLHAAHVELEGKECVVVGRSNIVGKPLAMLLLAKNGTVTVCHSKTRNLKEVCKRADILIAAIGKPEFITADYVKEGAVVIDVGINRLENKKLVGDVNFDEVSEKCSYITPVPGGVGPMTIAVLMRNTLKAFVIKNRYIP